MTWIDTLNIKKVKIFDSLDHMYYGTKTLPQLFYSLQFYLYAGIATYFGFQLLFLKGNYTQQTGNALQQFWYTITQLPFTSGSLQNPILNRGINSGGHELAYLAIVCLLVTCRLYLPKTAEGFYYSILIPAFAVSFSEGFFDIYYYYYYWYLYPHVTWDIFILTNPLAIFYIFSVITGTMITPVWKYMSRVWFILGLFFIQAYFYVWIYAGLPVTLSSLQWKITGNLDTQWYNNLFVNGLEIGQWYIASFSMSIAVLTYTIPLYKTDKRNKFLEDNKNGIDNIGK